MMASNILSRLLPSASDETLTYLNSNEPRSPTYSDHRQGVEIDEENLGERFQDQDLDHLLAEAAGSQVETGSVPVSPQTNRRPTSRSRPAMGKPRWMQPGKISVDEDEDVPESLLLEGNVDTHTRGNNSRGNSRPTGGLPPPVPGPSTDRVRAQWNTAQAQQRLHDDTRNRGPRPGIPILNRRNPMPYDRKERALWMWANVQDLDAFLQEIYQYYVDRGVWSIILSRVLWLIQIAFIIGFGTFVAVCIDFRQIPQKTSLSEVIHPKCFQTRVHGLWSLGLWLFFGWWLYNLVTYSIQIPRLFRIHDFYHHLLDVPDRDIQTVSWQLIVSRLMALRDSNIITAQNISAANRKFIGTQSKTRMDAHDIANRLMRRENYLIALFNKDILDLSITIPFLGRKQFFSRTTEWHVALAVLDFVFDDQGHVRRDCLADKNRSYLIDALKRRFVQTGLISIVCAPFSAAYYAAWIFFRYFAEFQKDPGQLGARSFTRVADWKFREFNELPHLFEIRRNMALAYSDRYLQQFPKYKTEQLATFVTFIASSLLAVLGVAAALDSESFLGFHITEGRTALFYITVITTIWYAARNSGPQEEPTMEPKLALSFVIECTRYCPASWKDRLHSDEVRQEFTSLYQLKLVNILIEFSSIIVTPFILMYQLPKCAERIVDFFREFTIHVDGLGNVCSFAVFDFKKGVENIARNRPDRAHDDGLRDDYYSTKDAKLVASVMGFQDTYVTNAASTRRFNRKTSRFPFEPPPQFDLYHLAADPQRQSMIRSPNIPRAAPQSTPRVAAQPPVRAMSPMHSILLDPHHQPSTSFLRSSQAHMRQPQPRGASKPRTFSGLDESPELAAQHLTTSRIIEEDSNLGDSWRTQRAAQVDDEDEDGDGKDKDEGPGVLGLLYQFQRKQTQGRGPGAPVV